MVGACVATEDVATSASPEFADLYGRVVDLQAQLLACHLSETAKLRESLAHQRPKFPGLNKPGLLAFLELGNEGGIAPSSIMSSALPLRPPLDLEKTPQDEERAGTANTRNDAIACGAPLMMARSARSNEASRSNSKKARTPPSEAATAPATGEVDEMVWVEDVVLMERVPIDSSSDSFRTSVKAESTPFEAEAEESRAQEENVPDVDDQDSVTSSAMRVLKGTLQRADSLATSASNVVPPPRHTNASRRSTWVALQETSERFKDSKSTNDFKMLMGNSDFSASGSKLETMLNGPGVEMVFATALVVNACFMALEYQCTGADTGFVINFYDEGVARCSSMVASLLEYTEFVFGCIFSLEACLKVVGQKHMFFLDVWNYLDVAIVASWLVALLGEAIFPVPPGVLRLLRLARLMRLLRLARQIQGLDAVFLMTTAIKGSASVLAWAMALLLAVQLMLALLLNQLLQETYFSEEIYPLQERQEVYEYFGTVTRSLMSMFELTLANWPPVARLLAERVSEWFMLFSVLHKLAIGFAVVGVINGVFMQETFKAAATDDRIMVRNKEKAVQVHTKKMKLLFQQADTSREGQIGLDAFREVMSNDSVRMWLASMELDAGDADKLFYLLDDGDGCLTADELVKGVARLKGHARSVDLATLMLDQKKTQQLLRDLLEKILL